MANPTVRATSTASVATGSPTCALPAGTVNGDVLVASVSDPNGSASNPGGWTLLYGPTIVGTRYLSIWSKVAASEPGSWTWPGSGSGYVVNVAAIQDCNSATPAASAAQNNASSVNLVAPSITPGVANSLLIGAFMVEASVTDITPAGTMTEDQDAARGANYRVELAHESYAPATATGTRTATATAAGPNTGWLGAFANVSGSGVGGTPAYRSYWPSEQQAIASFNVRAASTIVVGDALYIGIITAAAASNPTITGVPAGWALLDTITVTNARASVYWKIAGASEPANYTFTSSAACDWSALCIAIATPGDTVLPNDGHAIQANAASTSIVCPSVTSTRANGLLLAIAFNRSSGGLMTADPLMTAIDLSGGTYSVGHGSAWQALAAAAATGTRTFSYNLTGQLNMGWSGVVLGPPVGAPPTGPRAEPFFGSL